MKYSHQEAFEKHLKSAAPNNWAAVYLIVSKEAFERGRAVDKVMNAVFGAKAKPPLTFEGPALAYEALMQELNTIPFFDDRLAVLVQDCDKMEKDVQQKLAAYFVSPNPQVLLILTAESIPQSSAFYKKAERGGVILDMPEMKRWEKERAIEGWLSQRFKEEGKILEGPAAQMMARQLGTDKALLNREVEKLVCYVGTHKMVSAQDVQQVCTTMNLESIWKLGEFVLNRDAGGALRVCRGLMADGLSLLGMIAQLRGQLHNAYEVCSLMHAGQGVDAVAKRFPYLTPKLLEKNIRMAQRYGLEPFRKAILLLNETELRAKNATVDYDVLAETMVARLAS